MTLTALFHSLNIKNPVPRNKLTAWSIFRELCVFNVALVTFQICQRLKKLLFINLDSVNPWFHIPAIKTKWKLKFVLSHVLYKVYLKATLYYTFWYWKQECTLSLESLHNSTLCWLKWKTTVLVLDSCHIFLSSQLKIIIIVP